MTYNREDLERIGIYCIRNKVNNKVYIGKSINIYKRIVMHVCKLNMRDIKHENQHFINAWHKYGRNNFEYFVLEHLELDEELLKEREMFWMNIYESTNRDKGYNLRMDSSTNMIVNEETRKKLSIATTKRFSDPEVRKQSSITMKLMWDNNPELKKQVSKKNRENNSKYYIDQYDKQSNFIKRWNYVSDITDENPSYKRHNIYSVCSGAKPSMYGFVWKKVLKEDIVQP